MRLQVRLAGASQAKSTRFTDRNYLEGVSLKLIIRAAVGCKRTFTLSPETVQSWPWCYSGWRPPTPNRSEWPACGHASSGNHFFRDYTLLNFTVVGCVSSASTRASLQFRTLYNDVCRLCWGLTLGHALSRLGTTYRNIRQSEDDTGMRTRTREGAQMFGRTPL